MGLKSCLMKLMKSEGATPLPGGVLTALFFVFLLDVISAAMVFSFLPKLVKSFGTSEVDTGYQVGLIAASVYIGRAFFSLPWGYVADVKGKKTVLIVSTTLLMFSTLAFGFTNNFYWAVTTRFIQGGSSAIIITTKSILADVCDNTNIALGMSILFSGGSFGIIIGPSMAGFLVFPCERFPNTFKKGSIFGRFGILLPNLIATVCLAISIVLVAVLIPERARPDCEKTSLLKSTTPTQRYVHDKHSTVDDVVTKRKPHYTKFSVIDKDSVKEKDRTSWLSVNRLKSVKLFKLFQIKECIHVSLLYGTYCIAAIGVEELFPLFAATSIEYNGMNFSTSQIGLTLLMVSAFFLPAQVLVIPRITQRLGSKKTFILTNFLAAFSLPWIPIFVAFVSNSGVLWAAVVFILFLQRFCYGAGSVTVNILLNNSVTPDLLGSANGFGMAVSSIGRSIGPAALGGIYAWSLSNIKYVSTNTDPIGFPFNQHFAFYIVSLVFILSSIMASTISPTLDKSKIITASAEENESGCSKI